MSQSQKSENSKLSGASDTTSPEETSEVLEIVQVGARVLRQRAQQVDPEWIRTDECQSLIDSMIVTMRDAPGVGLAAPQIGIGLQIFVCEDPGVDDETDATERERYSLPLHVFINPSLELVGKKSVDFYEGCLSLAGFAAVVYRAECVRVTGLDRNGEMQEEEWNGWSARILQHEFDHLQGDLYIDRMQSRTFATLKSLSEDND